MNHWDSIQLMAVLKRQHLQNNESHIIELTEKGILEPLDDTYRTTPEFDKRVSTNEERLSLIWRKEGLKDVATLYSLIQVLKGVDEAALFDYLTIILLTREDDIQERMTKISR